MGRSKWLGSGIPAPQVVSRKYPYGHPNLSHCERIQHAFIEPRMECRNGRDSCGRRTIDRFSHSKHKWNPDRWRLPRRRHCKPGCRGEAIQVGWSVVLFAGGKAHIGLRGSRSQWWFSGESSKRSIARFGRHRGRVLDEKIVLDNPAIIRIITHAPEMVPPTKVVLLLFQI